MHLLALSGDRDAALTQFELLRRILSEEFGAEPSPDTSELCRLIQSGGLSTSISPVATTSQPKPVEPAFHNLPTQATGFVGREEELRQIQALLINDECRLVTLTGPGGIGKTRLAQQAVWKLIESKPGIFNGGIFFVPLAATNTSEMLALTIAGTMGITLHPQLELMEANYPGIGR